MNPLDFHSLYIAPKEGLNQRIGSYGRDSLFTPSKFSLRKESIFFMS